MKDDEAVKSMQARETANGAESNLPFETQLVNWNSRTIYELEKTSLLNGQDLLKLKRCAPAAIRAFNTTQMFRTSTEMRVSVLNDVKFPTPDAKYWQAVREMNVMVENLIMLSFNYREKVIEHDMINADIKELSAREPTDPRTDLLIQKKIIDLQRKDFEITIIQREAHHRIREIEQWKNIQDQLEPQVVGGTEEVNNHQLFSYAIRFLQELKLAEEGHADKSLEAWRNLNALVTTTIATITSLKMRKDLIEVVKQDERLLQFCLRKQIFKKCEITNDCHAH